MTDFEKLKKSVENLRAVSELRGRNNELTRVADALMPVFHHSPTAKSAIMTELLKLREAIRESIEKLEGEVST